MFIRLGKILLTFQFAFYVFHRDLWEIAKTSSALPLREWVPSSTTLDRTTARSRRSRWALTTALRWNARTGMPCVKNKIECSRFENFANDWHLTRGKARKLEKNALKFGTRFFFTQKSHSAANKRMMFTICNLVLDV